MESEKRNHVRRNRETSEICFCKDTFLFASSDRSYIYLLQTWSTSKHRELSLYHLALYFRVWIVALGHSAGTNMSFSSTQLCLCTSVISVLHRYANISAHPAIITMLICKCICTPQSLYICVAISDVSSPLNHHIVPIFITIYMYHHLISCNPNNSGILYTYISSLQWIY